MPVHEDLTRVHETQGSSDSSFGIVIAVAFGVVALLPLLQDGEIRWWAVAAAAAFATLAVFRSAWVRPLNRLWTGFGKLLSRVVSPIVLAVIFYGVLTPVGLLMRATGKDPLRLRRKAVESYWITRATPGGAPASMKDQF